MDNNSVVFEVWLKDHVKDALKNMGSTSRSVFGGMGRDIADTQRGMDYLGGHEYRLRVDTSGLRQAADEMDNLRRKAEGMSTLDIFKGSFLGSLASRGLERGISGLKELGRNAFDIGADIEQQIVGLGTFLGDDKAKSLYAKLQKDSAHTPFTTNDILPGMLQLISTGQTPERSQKDMWSLMNALSVTGNAGNAFALQLGESHLASMASTGKADAMFMKEFERTLHIPMTKLLAEEMFPNDTKGGMKKIADWKQSGELGQHVTYDLFVGAMEKAAQAGGMFANGLERASQTIKGKESTIKDWWQIGMGKVVNDPKTHDNIIRLEDRIIKGLENFPELIARGAPIINGFFDKLEMVLPSLGAFGESVLNLLKPVGSVLFSDGMVKLGKGMLDMATMLTDVLLPPMKLLAASAQAFIDLLPKGKKERPSLTDYTAPYVWDSSSLHGALPDAAKMKAIQDSMQAKAPFGTVLFLPNKQSADSFEAATFKDWKKGLVGDLVRVFMPAAAAPAKTTTPTPAAATEDTNESILGGGKHVVNITFRNFVENLYNQVGSKGEGQAWTVNELKIMFNQMLAGIPR